MSLMSAPDLMQLVSMLVMNKSINMDGLQVICVGTFRPFSIPFSSSKQVKNSTQLGVCQ